MSATIINESAFNEKPAVVFFDFDNTLYPYRSSHEAGMSAVREKANRLLSVSTEDFDKAFHDARKELKERVGRTAASHNRLLYFHRTIELLGLRTQVIMALDLEQTYWATYLDKAKLFEGVTSFLDVLRVEGIKTALVTDLTAQIQYKKLIYLRLEHAFDFVVTSEEAGSDKPHPAPFDLALTKVGNETGKIWMIGDNFDSDIKGAREAIGATTLMRCDNSTIFDKTNPPDLTFQTFEEIRTFTKKLIES